MMGILGLERDQRVDFYKYILCYCPLNKTFEPIAFQGLGSIHRIQLEPAIEQPAQKVNVQIETHLHHCKVEESATEWEDKPKGRKRFNNAQASQTKQNSVFPLSGLIREFIQNSIKYRWSDRLRLFGFRLIPLLALAIVLGFFTQKQITIGRLRSVINDAKGQIDSPARLTALKKLVKLGEPLKNIPLHNANLKSANFNGVNLSGAYLDRANLNGANLYQANLNGANLYQANLNGALLNRAFLNSSFLNGTNLAGANLNGAFLSGAFLESANLNSSNLNDANLNGANLNRARLMSANLNGAKLVSANFDGANLNGTKLVNANLYGANFNNAEFGCVKSSANQTICTNLTNAKNLTPQQVKQAKNWQQAIYDPEFRKKLGLPSEQSNSSSKQFKKWS
ncbi:pentapeptide repeat-containing protein [Aetokthonos hydrillicola CCALA 1050]|nr:pentapeptide repeat-containing protein [Aetokthonos hydrillicola CCALA 1050]